MPKRTSDTTYRTNRAIILDGNPGCALCGRPGADTADHIIPYDAGGTDELDNLRPAHHSCNSRAGARYLNQKRTIQQNARKAFFDAKNEMPPTPSFRISENGLNGHDFAQVPAGTVGVGVDQPRLVTARYGYESFGGLVGEWSASVLGRPLFPWQLEALEGALEVTPDGKFAHPTAIVSTSRQNGKTTMLSALVGWLLTELPKIWARPVSILSTAHELALAVELFDDLSEQLELWEEAGLAKVTWAYGRNKVVMADKSSWVVKAATGKKHGGTYDVIIGDELWALSEAAIFGALKPSQIAVPSPLMLLTSTAGDESSRAFIRLREQAVAQIDRAEPGAMFYAEWSLPPGVDPLTPEGEAYWGYANPSLGRTITVEGLRDAASAPDKNAFMRAHMNVWVSAAGSWMNPGDWEQARTEQTCPTGGWLVVDSSVDDSKYVGVRAGKTDEGVVVTVDFVADNLSQMWRAITDSMAADPSLQLAVTPTLDLHTPEGLRKRVSTWGYAELLKYTALVRNLIREGTLTHTGEELLAEHVNRAVLVRAQGAVVISSQKSPGPIELARCMVVAAAFTSKPGGKGRPMMGSAR